MRLYTPLLFLIILSCQSNQVKEEKEADSKTFITAGGTITEIVYELGFGDRIIATDITSTYPESMQDLPSIGYRNQIKAEGILALGADAVLAERGYLDQDVIQQLESTQIEVHQFEKPMTVEETYQLIDDLSEFLKAPEQGDVLKKKLEADILALEEYKSAHPNQERIAFVMARGAETVFLAGEETFAEELFESAGLENTADGFTDFIPLTPEALIEMNPEYLLLFESGLSSLGGEEGARKINGLDQTDAFKAGNIIAMDGHYISGFGPRLGQAALELAKAVKE